MFEEFLNYCRHHNLFAREDNILLGVSGGVDSMVMLDLFLLTEVQVGVAHVNFQLRGEESDEEQKFVERYVREKGLAFHTISFDTHEYAEERGISVQVAARDLRYNWFEKLMRDYDFTSVAVAHNKDDVVETFLINLARGTGLKGITGIKPRQNNIIRPVLFARREEIIDYCVRQGLEYREDSSNRSTKYSRNRIRHNIIPEFEKINPRFTNTIAENVERFQSAYNIYYSTVKGKLEEITIKEGTDLKIDIEGLKTFREKETLLFEVLKTYSFAKEIVPEIMEVLDSEPGRRFYSKTHELLKDRDYLIITPNMGKDTRRYYIESEQYEVTYPVRLQLEFIENTGEFKIPANPNIACLDYDALTFPLIIRKWQQGDYFKPLGLNHYKKLSDFFIDKKFSLLDKERTWLLTSGEKIAWIIGERIDEGFKITGKTSRILKITYFED